MIMPPKLDSWDDAADPVRVIGLSGMAPSAVVAGTSLLNDGVVIEVTEAENTLPVEPGRVAPLVVAVIETMPIFDSDDDGDSDKLPDVDVLMGSGESTGAVPPKEIEDVTFPPRPVPRGRLEGPEPTGDIGGYEKLVLTEGTGDRVELVLAGEAMNFDDVRLSPPTDLSADGICTLTEELKETPGVDAKALNGMRELPKAVLE